MRWLNNWPLGVKQHTATLSIMNYGHIGDLIDFEKQHIRHVLFNYSYIIHIIIMAS